MQKITTNHHEIKSWAEKHQGIPELVDHKDARHDRIGLRINFPGPVDDALLSETNPPQKITWEKFFAIFEEQGLAFEYDNEEKFPDRAYRFANRE
jgi:hypothetical protein